MENDIVLQPEYVEKFHCDGSRCNSKCCGNWLITIDTEAYKKYQHVKNPAIRKKILSALEPNPAGQGFRVKLRDNGVCPMVCDDSLCYIQRNLGEDALSMTCKCYPRMVKRIGAYQFRTLNMSCPLAAEQALFSDSAMNIQQFTANDDTPAWHLTALRAENKPIPDGDDLLAVHIIMSGLAILQNTAYTMEKRLVLLGLFIDKLENEVHGIEAVSELVTYYNSEQFQQEISSLWDNWQFSSAEHKKIMEKILNVLDKENILDLAESLLHVNENYDEVYAERHEGIEMDMAGIWERYWQQEWLHHVFPCAIEGSFMHNYFTFLLAYEVAKLYIYGVYKPHENNNILEMFRFFSKAFDHSKSFLETLTKEAADFEAEPLKFMQILLRLK